MSDLDPRSDEAYRRAAELADDLRKAFERRLRVRDRLRLWWLRLEYWLGIR